MANFDQRHRLADLLEQVVEGSLRPIDALKQAEKWTDMPLEGNDVSLAFHSLMHFHIDADIREKNSEYDEAMKHGLRLHISKLRAHFDGRGASVNLRNGN